MDVINIIINVFFYIAGMIAQHYIEKKDTSTKELISWQHGYNEGYEVAYEKGFSDAKSIYDQNKTEDQPKQITETSSSSEWKHKFVRKKTHAGKRGV